jgi:hypothetical protein
VGGEIRSYFYYTYYVLWNNNKKLRKLKGIYGNADNREQRLEDRINILTLKAGFAVLFSSVRFLFSALLLQPEAKNKEAM